jgi:RHS repeat-associated protein
VGWNGSTESQSRKVVFGETMDEVLEHTDVTADPDDVYYAHSDMLGSLQIMVDDSGAIAESYRYREFGDGHVVVDSSFSYTAGAASAFLNGSRYTGRDWMGVVGSVSDPWYHYRARAYRADAGRFVQRDGVEFSGEKKNSYPYVLNQPIGMTDPTGHVAFGPGITTPTIDRIGFFPGFIGPGLIHGQALPPASGPMHTGPLNVLSLKTIGSCLPLAFSVTVRTDCPVGQCHCAYKPSTPFAQNPKVTVDAPGFWSCVVNTSASGSYLLPGGPACPAGFACGCADMLVTCTGQSVCAGQQQQVLFKWTSCNPDQLTVPWQTGDAPVIDLTPFGQC